MNENPKKNATRAGLLPNGDFLIPFSGAWWRAAVRELYDVRKLCVAAMMAALSVLLQFISIPLTTGLRLQVTFTVSAVSGVLLGPLLSLMRGAVSDVVGFLVTGEGNFFFGYTLSAMLSAAIYSCFFWRQKIGFGRVLGAKALVSLGTNAALGSLWNVIVFGSKSYAAYFGLSLAKQIVMYPIEVLVILLLFGALTKPLCRFGWMPKQEPIKTTRGRIVVAALLAVVAAAVAALAFLITPSLATYNEAVAKAISGFFGGLLKPVKAFFADPVAVVAVSAAAAAVLLFAILFLLCPPFARGVKKLFAAIGAAVRRLFAKKK